MVINRVTSVLTGNMKPIEFVFGSDAISIEIELTDVTEYIVSVELVNLYHDKDGTKYRLSQSADINDMVVSFVPKDGFLLTGLNRVQMNLINAEGKHIYTVPVSIVCGGNFLYEGTPSEKETAKTYLERIDELSAERIEQMEDIKEDADRIAQNLEDADKAIVAERDKALGTLLEYTENRVAQIDQEAGEQRRQLSQDYSRWSGELAGTALNMDKLLKKTHSDNMEEMSERHSDNMEEMSRDFNGRMNTMSSNYGSWTSSLNSTGSSYLANMDAKKEQVQEIADSVPDVREDVAELKESVSKNTDDLAQLNEMQGGVKWSVEDGILYAEYEEV